MMKKNTIFSFTQCALAFINRSNELLVRLSVFIFSQFSTAKCSYFALIPFESFNLFQSSLAFHIETNHLLCSSNQVAGFLMKCYTLLKWVKHY